MRSTVEIIVATQDSSSVTLEEAKLALLVMSAISGITERRLRTLAEGVLEGKAVAKMQANESLRMLTHLFAARKLAPAAWLGAEGIPGTPEHAERQRVAKSVFKKATGLDLDDPRSFEEQEKGK